MACGDTPDGSASDAAGTLDGPDVIVNAVTEEVFTVGSVVGDTWDTFGRVSSVHFDAQANLHIFDSQLDHILVVGPDGSLIRTVGGRGEGPGEFDNVNTAIVGRDGSYTVMGFFQIDLLEPDGEFVRRITLDPITTGLVMADLALPDGRLVGHVRRSGGDDEQSGEGSVPIHIFPLDDTEPELLYAAWELPEEDADESAVSGTLETGMRMYRAAGRAFEPRLDFDVLTDGRLALIDSIGYRVKLIGLDGSVTGTVERPIAPLPVDDAIMEAERERYREAEAGVLASASTNFPIEIEREGAGLMAYIERDEMDVPTVRVVRLVALDPQG